MSARMFSDEFIDLLAERVAEKLRAGGDQCGEVRKPYTVDEAAEVLRVSKDVIYSRVRAKQIATVPEVGRVIIPYPEMQRLLEGRAL